MKKIDFRSSFIIALVGVSSLLTLSGCGSSKDAGIFRSVDAGATYQTSNRLGESSSLANEQIVDLANHPKQPLVVYAAINDKGLVRSQDGGETWQTTSLNTGTVRELIFHPSSPTILYAAYGQQIITSRDGGATFETLYAGPSVVTALALNSAKPSMLWAGTQTGQVILSENAGKSWSVVKTFKRAVTDVLVSPIEGSVVVGTQGQGLYISADRGATFIERTPSSKNTSGLKSRPNSILVMSQSAQIASPLIVATTVGLFTTKDLGLSWQPLSAPIITKDVLATDLLVLSDNNSRIILLAGNNVARSDDGGKSWFTRALPTERLAKSIVIVDPGTYVVGIAGKGISFVERVI